MNFYTFENLAATYLKKYKYDYCQWFKIENYYTITDIDSILAGTQYPMHRYF
jgi:hypothetical protein